MIGRFIRAGNVEDGWYRGLGTIWTHGDVVEDERGIIIKEYLNLMVVVENLDDKIVPNGFSWSRELLEEYAQQLLEGENVQKFEYTYGERLRGWNCRCGDEKTDQISYVVDKLTKSPESRRAVAVTWIPPIDTEREEVPCMIINDFKLRKNKLNLTAYFRSHDFAGAYPANVYALNRLLEFVAGKIGCEKGVITTVSASAHIYEHDWDKIHKLLFDK